MAADRPGETVAAEDRGRVHARLGRDDLVAVP